MTLIEELKAPWKAAIAQWRADLRWWNWCFVLLFMSTLFMAMGLVRVGEVVLTAAVICEFVPVAGYCVRTVEKSVNVVKKAID